MMTFDVQHLCIPRGRAMRTAAATPDVTPAAGAKPLSSYYA